MKCKFSSQSKGVFLSHKKLCKKSNWPPNLADLTSNWPNFLGRFDFSSACETAHLTLYQQSNTAHLTFNQLYYDCRFDFSCAYETAGLTFSRQRDRLAQRDHLAF